MKRRLEGNPVCSQEYISNSRICHPEAIQQTYLYKTDLAHCKNQVTCPEDFLKVDPGSCGCAMPYVGIMVFRAPIFSILTDPTRFHKLENSLWTELNLTMGSVYIRCMSFDGNGYLNIQVLLFPQPGKKNFERLQLVNIIYALSSQAYTPPPEFGPYYFRPTEFYNFYNLLDGEKLNFTLSTGFPSPEYSSMDI